MIRALGASPWRIARDIAAEAALLGLIASTLGAALALGLGLYLQRYGIDTSGFGSDASFNGMAFDPLWYAQLSAPAFVDAVIFMWMACVLASLYPASVAARLQPVEAMGRV